MTDPIEILQITDLHLLAEPGARLLGVDTADSLRAVLDHALARHQPAAIIATGDITHHGEPEAYARFDAILAEFYSGPVLALPGNHDLADPMRKYAEPAAVLELPGWDVIGLDSHQDGEPGARISETQLEALRIQARSAAAAGRYALLAVHNPPVAVNCPWLDKDKIQNADKLLEWLAAESTVAACIFGHAHQSVERSFDRLSLLGTPATCFQFLPESESFAIDTRGAAAMPGYRWLQLGADGSWKSGVRRVDDYPLNIELPAHR